MVAGDTKKIIVIRDINSDIIEEAILILKNEPKGENGSTTIDKKDIMGIKGNEYLLKEARFIINNYNKVCKKTAWERRKGMSFRTIPKGLRTIILINGFVFLTAVFMIIFVIKLI